MNERVKLEAGRLYLKNVIGENPLIDELLPDNPTDGDFEEMRDFYAVTLDAEKTAARKDADLGRAIKTPTHCPTPRPRATTSC